MTTGFKAKVSTSRKPDALPITQPTA